MPTKDELFHNRIETMTLSQQCRFDAMLLVSHILNCALTGDRERSSGKCLTIQYTYFLHRLHDAFEGTVIQTMNCSNILVFDDFIRIADFSFAAIKEILVNPSTRIQKVDTKMLANRARGFGTKTMQWMSQRPGRTIEEKISPENKVLTTKTIFTTDTKENREFMYLYRILYDAIVVRTKNTGCLHCNKKCEYYNWVVKVQRLLAANLKIKTGELSEVKPIKQAYQNNKLMCDKNYKIIWDAVKMLSTVEEKINDDFDETNLFRRLAVVLYWLVVSRLLRAPGAMIVDRVGELHDENGQLWFGDDGETMPVFEDTVLIKNKDGKLKKWYTVKLTKNTITIENGTSIVFLCNVDDYFTLSDRLVTAEEARVAAEKAAAEQTATVTVRGETHEQQN